jgi:tetratricopeptide (TPR) repeat protein
MGKISKGLSPIFKFSIIFLFVVVFLLISELLYILNNKPASIFSYFLDDVKNSAMVNDLPKAMRYIQTGSRILIFKNCARYKCPTKIANTNLELLWKYPDLFAAYLNQLKGADLENNSVHPDFKLGKIYYSWGLSAYKSGNLEIAPIFWQMATYLNPELPTFHLELINFYLSSGDYESGRQFLDFCLNIPGFPQKGCEEYLERHFLPRQPLEVGFWEKEIEEHYSYR